MREADWEVGRAVTAELSLILFMVGTTRVNVISIVRINNLEREVEQLKRENQTK